MYDVWREFRHTCRSLTRKPLISTLAILSLGLGIGVNSTIFSLVNALLLGDLPFADADRVVEVYTSDSGGMRYATSSYPDFLDLRREATTEGDVFEHLVAHSAEIVTHDDGEETELLFGESVSGNFFDFAGLPMSLGRGFSAEEDREPHPVVVLGHDFWQQRYGGDPGVIGESLQMNGIDFTVIGVAPEQLRAALPVIVADYFLPVAMHDRIAERASLERRGSRSLFLKGRLAENVDIETAQARFDVLAQGLAASYPETNEGREITLISARDVALNPALDKPLFGVAGLLLGLVALVLLIACSNIANLLLARAAGRRREIAVRLALGSSRWRLMRQWLSESVVLALLGGVLGMLFAAAAAQLIVGFQPPVPIPLNLDLAIDAKVLGFTFSIALLTGLICGLAPALQASRPTLVTALKGEDAALGGRFRRFGLRNALVVAQVAISTVLLVGSGLFVRSLLNAQSIDPGFSLQRGAAVSIALGFGNRYSEEEGRAFFQELRDRVAAVPEVSGAAYAEHLPLGLSIQTRGTQLQGQEELDEDDWPEIDTVSVGADYFSTLGIPLLRGREFDARDRAEAPPAAIVNEALAQRYWPDEEPIGKRLRFDEDGSWHEVVGVARNGKYRTLGETPRPFVYTALEQSYSSLATLVVSGLGDEGELLRQVRAELAALDRQVPIFEQKLMSEHLDVMLFPARLGAALLLAFGVLGLVLAAVGLYGVVAFSVARRTREVGIRMAIGAQRADVVRLVIREGMALVTVGLVLGLGAALAGSRLLDSLLFEIAPRDPLTFAGVTVVLVMVALLANLLPARRATRIDPVVALRYE